MARTPFFRGMTKTQLTAEIRSQIAKYDFDEVFHSDLISDLIYEHHWYCSIHKLRPEAFRKLYKPGTPYDFSGCFDGRWNLVSWTKCISQWTDTDWIVRALRDAARPFVVAHKRGHPICEVCQTVPATEVDHVDPEFNEIAEMSLAVITTQQMAAYIGELDWWSPVPFALPECSPALYVLRRCHETGTLQSVCKACHLSNAAKRKARA